MVVVAMSCHDSCKSSGSREELQHPQSLVNLPSVLHVDGSHLDGNTRDRRAAGVKKMYLPAHKLRRHQPLSVYLTATRSYSKLKNVSGAAVAKRHVEGSYMRLDLFLTR